MLFKSATAANFTSQFESSQIQIKTNTVRRFDARNKFIIIIIIKPRRHGLKPTFPNSIWNQWTKSHNVEMPLQNFMFF